MNPKTVTNKKNILSGIMILIVLAIGELLYFHDIIGSHNIMGLDADSLFVNMTLEHWTDVINGKLSIFDTRAFYPQTGTLAYSDSLLGSGIIYSLVRLFIPDVFSAFTIALITIHFIGVIFMFLLLRELKCDILVAVLGILLSFWSCSFTQLSYHTQFYSLSLVAIFGFFMIRFLNKKSLGSRKRLFDGISATVSFGTCWLSSFYISYIITLLLAIFTMLIIIHLLLNKQLARILVFVRFHIKELLFYSLLQLVWLVPLFMLYMPIYLSTSGYDFGFTLVHTPFPTDLLRTQSTAPLEGFLASILPSYTDPGYEYYAANRIMETSYGWSITAFLLFISAMIILTKRYRKNNSFPAFLCLAGVISTVVLFLMFCRYGNFTPLYYLRHLIPGLSAVRAPGRCMAIFTIPMAIIVCYSISISLSDLKKRHQKLPVLICLLLICILIPTCIATRFTNKNTADIKAIVYGATEPPSDCRYFFVFSPEESNYSSQTINMIGWLIADRFDLYTFNGYSGNFPDGWEMIKNDPMEYFSCAYSWLEDKGLSNDPSVYVFFYELNTWVRYSDIVINVQ